MKRWRWVLIGVALIVVLGIVNAVVNRPQIIDQQYYDTMLADVTDCSTLANFLQANLDAFDVELDRPDSSPERREMYLNRAKDVEYRMDEVGCR